MAFRQSLTLLVWDRPLQRLHRWWLLHQVHSQIINIPYLFFFVMIHRLHSHISSCTNGSVEYQILGTEIVPVWQRVWVAVHLARHRLEFACDGRQDYDPVHRRTQRQSSLWDCADRCHARQLSCDIKGVSACRVDRASLCSRCEIWLTKRRQLSATYGRVLSHHLWWSSGLFVFWFECIKRGN